MTTPPPLPGYDASASHPRLPSGSHTGRLTVDAIAAHFRTTDDRLVSIPLLDAEMRRGGPTGDLVQLVQRSNPTAMFWTTDQKILRDPSILAHTHLASQSNSMRTRRNCCWGGCLLLLLLMVGGTIAFIALRETIIQIIADRVPVTWEQKLGEHALAHVKQTMTLIEDPEVLTHLNALAKPLIDAVPPADKRYDYKLYLADDEVPNAFASPGGTIVVNSGLVLQAQRAEEVAGVLAHEIAHLTRRHSVRRIVRELGIAAMLQVFVGDVGTVAGMAVGAGEMLLTQSYSRDDEREADVVGWTYLVAANIDPRGLSDFFRRLEKDQKTSGTPEILTLLSTHPATPERIERLEAKQASTTDKTYLDLSSPFHALKAKLQDTTSTRAALTRGAGTKL